MGTDITLPIEDGFVNVRVGAIIEKTEGSSWCETRI